MPVHAAIKNANIELPSRWPAPPLLDISKGLPPPVSDCGFGFCAAVDVVLLLAVVEEAVFFFALVVVAASTLLVEDAVVEPSVVDEVLDVVVSVVDSTV